MTDKYVEKTKLIKKSPKLTKFRKDLEFQCNFGPINWDHICLKKWSNFNTSNNIRVEFKKKWFIWIDLFTIENHLFALIYF
jgi:hypothetical protein